MDNGLETVLQLLLVEAIVWSHGRLEILLAHRVIHVHVLKLLSCGTDLLLKLLLEQDALLSELLVGCKKFGVVFGILLLFGRQSWGRKNLLGMRVHVIVAGNSISILLASWKTATYRGMWHGSGVWIVCPVQVCVLTEVLMVLRWRGRGGEGGYLGSSPQARKQVRPARSWSRHPIGLVGLIDGGDLSGWSDAQPFDV